MSETKLHVEMPQGEDAKLWPLLSGKLIDLLDRRHGINEYNEEVYGATLNDILWEQEIKDIAVFIFGNDLPSTVAMVKQLRLKGNGACPQCGSDDREERFGGITNDEFDRPAQKLIGWRCRCCGKEVDDETD